MFDLQKIKELIAKCEWRWAKSYINVPHEYIVRGRCALTERDFNYIVNAQRELGTYEQWGKYNFPYLYIDGYKYWTMGSPINETTIINRQKVFGEYDQIAAQYDDLFNDSSSKTQDAQVADMLSGMCGSIYEVGCGTGLLLDIKNISPKDYQGIDPSRAMLDRFRVKHPSYSQRVSRKAFEESQPRYLDSANVVSLYGSISYIMKPYIEMLAQRHRGLFLMFYAQDCMLITYERTGVQMHHFSYAPSYLASIFKGCRMFPYGNYIIVTTLNFDMNRVRSVKCVL